MLGHSFGGKVALRWTRDAPTGLEQVWVVDSSPAAGEPRGSAWQMLTVLKSIPSEFVSRDDAITALTERAVAPPVAHWMSTNLQRSGERLRWRFDTDAIEALMLDFFQTDLWDVVEQPPAGVDVHFVKATESSVLSGEVLERVERIASGGRVHVHRVDGGHWINADNPDAVVELLVANANVAP
jgi:pimeloyl-ACP methyl ester carboxylesterase